MTATIEEMKVVLKTGCYRDFHINIPKDLPNYLTEASGYLDSLKKYYGTCDAGIKDTKKL
ncbi:hypothetical protein MTBBW1_2090012 [Desulfamplus magnetovallimortis]|uniref:Uncharacterized protein n=1 Tax=Desulfamplus magnetovallimortis TaxID=1246637 RepID=A0A1W1HCE0_9BACT|nr:hypothetical protein MTBBW1_2090012 [Desulfamplus magnetovallimortis]